MSLTNFIIEGKQTTPHKRQFTAAEKYQAALLSNFSEISQSFYALCDSETIVAKLTTRQSSLGKTNLLSYHIHNYLNETYILQCRLIQFPTTLFRLSKRLFKNSDHHLNANEQESINHLIVSAFANIVSVRGSHVHAKRYSDDDLSRLFMLERMAKSSVLGIQKPFLDLFRIEFSIYRKKWLNIIHTNNDGIEMLLDAYFDGFRLFLLDKTGKIKIPQNRA